jgi:hypothetical protein
MQKLLKIFLAIILLTILSWSYTISAQASNGITGATVTKTCDNKILSSGTLTGQFLENMCVDFCQITIKLDNGEEIMYYAFGDLDSFDAPVGTKVSINYNIEQLYIEEYTEPCVQDGVIKSIEIID